MREPKLTYLCDKKRHLVCIPYSIDYLHRMADELGIKRHWFHSGKYPHYDIPKTRMKEIEVKCLVISQREVLKLIKEKL